MKKVAISILTLSALASLGLGVATASATSSLEVRADEPIVTEAEHPTLYINELVYHGGESATWNSSNNQVTLGGSGRGFEYDAPTNAVIKATYVQSSAAWSAWSYIYMRASDNDSKPNNGFTNKGYWLKWAGDGRIWFYKDGTQISTVGAASARSYTSGKTSKRNSPPSIYPMDRSRLNSFLMVTPLLITTTPRTQSSTEPSMRGRQRAPISPLPDAV